jgi:hypothetical protein
MTHLAALPRQRQARRALAIGPGAELRSVARGSLFLPSGPDGEGQARGQDRSARGEPPQ